MYSIGIYMDQIDGVDFKKDSTVSIMRHLQNKAKVKLILPDSISYNNGYIYGDISDIEITSLNKGKYIAKKKRKTNLNKLDCIFFRRDPPVNSKYISQLQILRELQYQNTLVLNSPESLLKLNEKFLGNQLSQNKIPSIISSNINQIENFLVSHSAVVLKPLNLMAGEGIIKLTTSKNAKKEIKKHIDKYGIIIAQKYLVEVMNGDNRIIIYNGIIEKNVLTRYPPKGDFIANLARGGKYKINVIKKKHLKHLASVASYLRYHGIFFAGVDMIGDYITEVNITSPTGVQQIKSGLSLRIAKELIKEIKNYKTQ